MKQILLWISFALATAVHGASLVAAPQFVPELKPVQQEAQAANLAAQLLSRFHYKALPLDDKMSETIFDQYLKALDPERVFFVQADIDQLSAYRIQLDDAILNEDLTVPFSIFNLYRSRAAERFAYARSLLAIGFDFQPVESYQFAREKEAWPKAETEMRELWRKRVKSDWLRLKLAGNSDKSIQNILDKRYDNFLKRIGQLKSADVFQVFMNAYTMAIEPHTNYMGPRATQDFDISMKLSLVGIGAVLTQADDYATIRELVPGGPAMRSGQLESGDRIVGVAQGENGGMTDVTGWRLDDVVALIRGAVDSVVRLDVLPANVGPDGKHKLVSMIRKTISLEDQAAKASIRTSVDGKTARRVGVITLPSFYEDFSGRRNGDPLYRSATRDVARLLGDFKKQKVDSVLIDLRNNGGGSLAEAVAITGLFIDKGPVVQQRNANGEISVERDEQAGVAWDGPLGILINRGSASASEIFAAAIQDYGRGLIMGETSFGKGTVQSIVHLDHIAKNSQPQFGELRMTVAQFYRINGGTTQLRGVQPDIRLPAISDTERFGESSFDNALPWTQIKAADYTPVGDLKGIVPILSALHALRLSRDRDLQNLQQEIAEITLQRRKNLISLNEAARRKERDTQEAQLKKRESRTNAGGELASQRSARRDDGLLSDERNLASELAAEKKQKSATDVILNESVNILGDEVKVLKTDARLAARARSGSLPKIN